MFFRAWRQREDSGGLAVARVLDGERSSDTGCRSALQVLHQSEEGRLLALGRPGCLPGLGNSGNTCFMNAMLQCVLNTPGRLTEVCKAFADLTPRGKLSGHGLLGKRFAELVTEYDSRGEGKVPAWRGPLRQMRLAIAALYPSYRGRSQQDAYEFLGHLLDGLDENFRLLLQSQGAQLTDDAPDASIVRSVCGVSTFTSRWCHCCLQVLHADWVVDTALRLPLLSAEAQDDATVRAAEEETPISLEDLIIMARSREELDGYRCDTCERTALKTGSGVQTCTASQTSGLLAETRDILVVVLNRFLNVVGTSGEYSSVKVRRQVAVPTVLSLPSGDYRLYGIVSHIGKNIDRGHYIATVRSLRDHQWYQCDDASVRPLHFEPLYQIAEVSRTRDDADPYVVFFQRFKGDMDIAT